MSVVFIKFPFAFTNDGKRLNIREIEGSVRVGTLIEEIEGKYRVAGVTNDSECVSGVCPIR